MTVLLRDEEIDQVFVCKKFAPTHESMRESLYRNFVGEVKLLHLLNHPNVVRVFNYYLYPERRAGYILMEYIEGLDVQEYLAAHPDRAADVFVQAVDGFAHLEKLEILHRDVRPKNILISSAGVAKIIDFGFGKDVSLDGDFGKSITLNWWCEPPDEFTTKTYDFSTEVYFLGRLFDKILGELSHESFPFYDVLRGMSASAPERRIGSFQLVKQALAAARLAQMDFSEDELSAYRDFACELSNIVSKIERGAKYRDDCVDITKKLSELYRTVMLEELVLDSPAVIGCFVNGMYFYSKWAFMPVDTLRRFTNLLRAASTQKQDVILANLLSRLNAVERYEQEAIDDIPF